MSLLLSIDLPESLTDVVTEEALRNYGDEAKTNPEMRDPLARLTLGDIFSGGVNDEGLANCCLSGIWMLHHFLDDSHSISQDIDSPEGSFWHAIMHRWEGDFSNAKYWYRRVGDHPVFNEIQGNWDPFDFVDQCQADSREGSLSAASKSVAIAEWVTLFEYCFKNAP